jgi:hypothetical protein
MVHFFIIHPLACILQTTRLLYKRFDSIKFSIIFDYVLMKKKTSAGVTKAQKPPANTKHALIICICHFHPM